MIPQQQKSKQYLKKVLTANLLLFDKILLNSEMSVN